MRRTMLAVLAVAAVTVGFTVSGSSANGLVVGYVDVAAATMSQRVQSQHSDDDCGTAPTPVDGEELSGVLYNSAGSFLASVDLPNGATLDSFRYTFRDFSDGNTHAYLVRKSLVSGIAFTAGYTVLAEAHSSGAADLTRKVTDTSVGGGPVDTATYAYFVEIVNCDSTVEPIGVRVAYTTP